MEEQLKINSGLEDILKKSSELMSRKGYHATSMRDLARATGLSLSGLYHYFSSKQELLFLINYLGFSTLTKQVKADLNPGSSIDDRLKAFIRTHISYFCKHRYEMKVMTFGAQEIDGGEWEKIKKIKETYRLIGRGLVDEFIRSRSRSGQTLDRKALDRKTFLLFGMMNWIFGWYSEKKHGSQDELVEDIYGTFTAGVLQAGGWHGARKNSRSLSGHL